MNYIELINQFWRLRRSKNITAYEADMYYYLLNECNRQMWLNPFELKTDLMCAELGISRKVVTDLRNRLKQKGLIDFEEGQKNTKTPTYKLMYVTSGNMNGNMNGNINGNMNGNMNGNHINKDKTKTKLNKTDAYTSEQIENFKNFQNWIDENAKAVSELDEPFTIEQFLRIKKDYPDNDFITRILQAMHNWKELKKKHKSANLSFRTFARRELKNG